MDAINRTLGGGGRVNGVDKTLLFVAILDTTFVIAMIVLFCLFQDVPDSLVVAVFGATFGECGCCSYIWKNKKEMKLRESCDGGNDNSNLSDNSVYSGGGE